MFMSELILSPSRLSSNFELNFARYLQEIQKFPILEKGEEYQLALNVVNNNDRKSAGILIQSHLRLVAKMAFQFKKYGLAISDLVSEGNLGLMHAIKKFDPIKGFRFSTYAMLWIKAYMQDYILRSWSLVKIGTNVAQKKLFFNLYKIKKLLQIENNDSISTPNIKRISNDLGVSEGDVIEMDNRLYNSNNSLNNIVPGSNSEVGEFIESSDPLPEELAINSQESSRRAELVNSAMSLLNDREKDIFIKRNLLEKSVTLYDLGNIYSISSERVRQIEVSAINKIKTYILEKNIFN
ncbi:MAG: RNA polymerase sigma-32 factor [Rickettsiales bacterium]|jgi:RNA polymerase sigma-32 factor